MKKIQFIFGIHNHQPIGNFDFVFEDAFQKSYLPFIDVLESHPKIAMSIHFSGCLLDWLEEHHCDYLDRVARLVSRGNMEIMSAGYYEPVLALIPDRDKINQIKKLNQYIANRFNYQAKGLWLTERVWEPHLAKSINEAGIEYVTVDDYHFLASGIQQDELLGYFNTDEQGFTLGMFPISQKLRYTMPFADPEETIRELEKYASDEGDHVIVMADDGEKFGVWPGSYDRCHKKEKWLDRMMSLLEENSAWIKTTTFKDYFQSNLPRGRVYLPTVSYFEMSEWTLPGDRGEVFSNLVHKYQDNGNFDEIRPFIRGGTWRNFQSLYDESNWMAKRMTEISLRFQKLENSSNNFEPHMEQIRTDIFKAQCNCAYWHGIFGGLYLPHLRHAIYESIIRAETKMDEFDSGYSHPSDIDNDGGYEYRLNSNRLSLIIGEIGGIIRELDIRGKYFNLVNTMKRYRESYHKKILHPEGFQQKSGSIHDLIIFKDKDIDQFLQIDHGPRAMLVDHFLVRGLTAEQLQKDINEKGNFNQARFKVEGENPLKLHGTSKVYDVPVSIDKRLALSGNTLEIDITITNKGEKAIEGEYGCEFNFSLLGGHSDDRYYEINSQKNNPAFLDIVSNDNKISSVGLVTEWERFKTILEFEKKTDVWRFPVFTVSNSESGFEKVYQSSVVIPHMKLNIEPTESQGMKMTLKVEEW